MVSLFYFLNNLKENYPKMNTYCHHLLTWSFSKLYEFLSSAENKEDILKNVGNQTVSGPHWLPYNFFPHTMEVSGDQQLLDF